MAQDNGDILSDEEWRRLTESLALSPRQVQIVRCIVAGMSDKRIALDMDMSVATVRTHVSRLFKKLNIENRNELILLVFRHFRAVYPDVRCDGPAVGPLQDHG